MCFFSLLQRLKILPGQEKDVSEIQLNPAAIHVFQADTGTPPVHPTPSSTSETRELTITLPTTIAPLATRIPTRKPIHLPPEIVYLILSHLDPATTWLTCRHISTLYRHCSEYHLQHTYLPFIRLMFHYKYSHIQPSDFSIAIFQADEDFWSRPHSLCEIVSDDLPTSSKFLAASLGDSRKGRPTHWIWKTPVVVVMGAEEDGEIWIRWRVLLSRFFMLERRMGWEYMWDVQDGGWRVVRREGYVFGKDSEDSHSLVSKTRLGVPMVAQD